MIAHQPWSWHLSEVRVVLIIACEVDEDVVVLPLTIVSVIADTENDDFSTWMLANSLSPNSRTGEYVWECKQRLAL